MLSKRSLVSAIFTMTLSCVALSPPVLAAGQALRITQARLDRDAPQAGDTGRLLLKAVIDDAGAGATGLMAAVLANDVALRVDDGGHFSVLVPLTNCVAAGSGIKCSSDTVRVGIKRMGASSYHRVRVLVRGLSGSLTGTESLRSPVKLTVNVQGGDDLVDVISDCAPINSMRLGCRDRDRPNIILIVTDDQRSDTLQYMPRTLDRLASAGVTFTNASVSTPLCAPSRASILTGQYAHHHGVLVNGGTGGAPAFVGPDSSTLATWLHDAGYRTGMYGKYMTNYTMQCPPATAACYIPPGWDEWHVFVQQAYYDYRLAENGQINTFGATPADYSTDVIAAKAIDFINEAQGQAFFLEVGFQAPHQDGNGAAVPAVRHATTYGDLSPYRPPSYDEEDVTDKPPWVATQPRAYTVLTPFFTYGVWSDYVRATQIQTLLAVDEAIDGMLNALAATGQAENTVFVFTSDNGYQWGEHRYFFGKAVPYEESLRVPLIISYPRAQTTGRQEDSLALNVDLAPTLAELAGVVPPTAIDGVSLVPLIGNHPTPVRDHGVIEYWSAPTLELAWAGIRTPDWTYVPYANAGAGEAELYDLINDPYELENRAHDPAYQDEIAALALRLNALLDP